MTAIVSGGISLGQEGRESSTSLTTSRPGSMSTAHTARPRQMARSPTAPRTSDRGWKSFTMPGLEDGALGVGAEDGAEPRHDLTHGGAGLDGLDGQGHQVGVRILRLGIEPVEEGLHPGSVPASPRLLEPGDLARLDGGVDLVD